MMMNRTAIKKRENRSTEDHPRITVRFATPEDHQLVSDAAYAERLSVNAWLIRLAIEAAKRVRKAARAEQVA